MSLPTPSTMSMMWRFLVSSSLSGTRMLEPRPYSIIFLDLNLFVRHEKVLRVNGETVPPKYLAGLWPVLQPDKEGDKSRNFRTNEPHFWTCSYASSFATLAFLLLARRLTILDHK